MEAEARKLGLFDATMLVMGGVIGVGIFFTPQSVARDVPAAGPFLGLWALGGLLALAGALTFAELAVTFPRSGGWFVFLREAFGPFPAFLFAWIVLFVVSTGACAVIADFSASQFARLLFGSEVPASFPRLFGVGLLLGLTAIALTGVKRGALFQNLCMVLKLVAVGTFVATGLALALPGTAPAPTGAAVAAAAAPDLARGLVRASLPVLFSYGGWQLVTYIAPNVRDPQRTLPRAILIGSLGVSAVYLATNLAYVRVLGMEGLATTPDFAAEVARRALGPVGEQLLVAAMAVSSLGICFAILLATPGVYVAMAEEGLFFRALGRAHPATGAPVAALLLQGALAVGYFLWGRAALLTDAVVFAEWIFHALCGLALLHLRRSRPALPRPFRSPAYPFFPLLYTLLALGVLVGTLLQAEAATTLLGLGVLALGAVLYPAWRRCFAGQAAGGTEA